MKISIITTNYNTDKYLEETIKSVLNQKGDFELEYIITDGESTDGSLEIIKKYKDKLKYISEKDKGQSNGINKGLRMATGDIVAFLNADDIYLDNTLDTVVRYFKDNPECMWLTGYCKIIDENGKQIKKYITDYKNRKLRRFSFEQLLVEDCISQPATFWRRKLLDEVGYIDESLHYSMDQDLWARFAKKYKLHLIREYLACFRFTSDTKTGSNVDKTLIESKLVAQRYSNSKWLITRQWLSNLKRIFVYKYVSVVLGILRK